MTPNQKTIRLLRPACLIAAFCFLTAAAAAANEPPPAKKSEPRKIAARVNGMPIYVDQLQPGVDKSLKKYRKYGLKKSTPRLKFEFQSRALNTLIANELVLQASRKQKVNDLDARVEERLQKIKRKYRDEKGFQAYLDKNQITQEKLAENLRIRIRAEEYLKAQGVTEPPVAEKDKLEYYKSSPKLFERKESVNVSHILIKVDAKAAPEEKLQAREKIEKIRKEILGGRDFGEMAKQYSECNSASGGGGLGYISRGYMPEPFEKAAFAMKKGEVSNVVETKFGFHVIKLLDKVEAGIRPFNEVEGFVTKALQMEISKRKKEEHIQMLRDKAKIEILLKEEGA